MRALVLAFLISCTPAQAPRVHQVSEVALLVGIAGLLATGVAGAVTHNNTVVHTDYGFVPLMVAGAAVFWISDKPARRFEEEQAQQKFDAAFALAKAAKEPSFVSKIEAIGLFSQYEEPAAARKRLESEYTDIVELNRQLQH